MNLISEIDFRDRERLEAWIGRWSEVGPRLQLGQELINGFAELSGDHNWIHVDLERCVRESPFGGAVAHGNLVLSLIPRMRPEEAWRVAGHRQAINRGFNKVRFLRPVLAGSVLRCRAQLLAVEVGKKGTDLVKEYCVYRDGQDEPALAAEILLRYA